MQVYITQLVTAFVGSLGFALIFNVGRKHIWPASVCGFLAWGLYLICTEIFGLDVLVGNVITSAFCAVYAEVCARIMKTPTTVIFIPAVIPLIPGGSLYNTMYCAVHKDWPMCKFYGFQTLQTTLGIAVGLSFVSAMLYIFTNLARRRAAK